MNLGLGQPVLSFKLQVSLLDYRLGDADFPWTAYDRAVVQLQLADPAGAPVGSWGGSSSGEEREVPCAN